MTKLPEIPREILRFGLALGLLAWPSLRLLAAAATPPPPFVNAEAPPAPALVLEQLDGGTVATGADGTEADGTFNPGGSSVAAPQISDEQQIKNAVEMAYQLYHAEDYENCGRATAAILERYPKMRLFWVRYLHALSLEHQDFYTKAIEQYELVRKEAPRSTYSNAASFRIGLCQSKSGQKEEAIYTLREIIENHPRSEYRLQAYLHLGNLYRQTRDWRAAQRIYRDIVRVYPRSSWAWTATLYLAETHSNQGRNETAIRVYEGLERNPDVPKTMRAQAQLRIGDLFIAEEKWLEALHTYRVALRDYSDVPGVAVTSEQKIAVATEGRRYGRVPYRKVNRGVRITEAPPDADYRLRQQQEKLPYQ
jgi:TolA-binding protein